jgi:hypothetical protein
MTLPGLNDLLTWNRTHIAIATLRPRIEAVCLAAGYEPPLIYTPEELRPRNAMQMDSMLQEVRAAREAYARAHGYDVRAMVADLRAQDDRGDWPVVRLSPRRPAPPGESDIGPHSTARRPRTAGAVAGQA